MRLERVSGDRLASCLIQTHPLANAKMPPDRQERQPRETIMSDSKTKVGLCHNRTNSRFLLAAVWATSVFCCLNIAHKTEAALQHATADEPTSLPAHQLMLNNQQIFHQEPELGNPNQGAIGSDNNQQRPQPLSLRALPVSSRGTLAFVPRGNHARADSTSPTQVPSHVLSNLDWCSRLPLDPLRSTTEVLAVEGESIKLNFVIIGQRAKNQNNNNNNNNGAGARAPKSQQRTSSVHQQNGAHQQAMRLRLHWQRDNQLIGDLNLARGRFSSTQLAGGDEPDVLRRMLVAHPSEPQQAGGSDAPHDPTAQRVYNATRAWHFGARQKIGTMHHNKGEKDYLFSDRDDDILYYHLDQNLLFKKLFSITNKKKLNNNYQSNLNNLNLLNDKKETNEDQDTEQQYQNQVQDEVQDQASTTKHSFALYPSINVRHLETFQRQATVTAGATSSSSLNSGTSSTSAGDQISLAARQAIAATLKRVSNQDQKQQQQASGSSGSGSPATTNTNVNKNRFLLRQPFGDNFLADGQAIDWPTLGLYLQAHNALRLSANGRAKELNAADKDEDEIEDQQQHHLCQQQQQQPLELDQLIVIQFEISQLRAQDRGQYQLHVCQQSALAGVANHQAGQNCLQSQLVAVISLQVIEDVPRLESWFEPQLLNPGDRLSIKCEATGYTLPQISWYLDGQLLSEHQAGGGGRLSSNGDVDDSGQGDDHLLLSSSSTGGGRSGGPFGYQPSRARSVISSSHQSNQFFRIGDYVSQDNHVHSFVNSSALRLADGGHYKCRANNGHHLVEHEARIDVRGPATIERPLPYNASALQGLNSRWTVQCPYSGYPVASIEWYFRADSTLKSIHLQQQHQISPVADQQVADYTMETGSARLAREVPRASPAGKRTRQRPTDTTISSLPEDQQDNLDEQDQLQPTDREEYTAAGLMSADEPGDAPDPDKDEWLSQASAMTMSPNGEDYPESLPDYPLPVAANQDSPGGYNLNRKGHLLPADSKTASLDTDEFELSAETEDSLLASRLAPDYGDIEMSYQQQQQQLTRRRRSLQVPAQVDVEWVKLPQSRRHQVHPNGTMSIYDIQQADQGHYKCRVLAPGARHDPQSGGSVSQQLAESSATWSNELYLSVLVPPSISPFSSSESLREGMRNFLTCSVIEGDSPVRLSWLKDGAPIEEHMAAMSQQHSNHSAQQQQQPAATKLSRIKVETSSEFTSTLSFSHVEFRDNGNYTCIATNKAASVNYTAKMVVNVPPKWTKNPRDLECVAGQNIVIDCQAEGHPSPRIWWEIGVSSQGAPRSAPESKQEELLSSKQVALALTAAAAAGSGATQQFGSSELPTMTMMTSQQQQHEQPPNHYRTIISNSRIHILENASLVIRDVGRQDQGYYLCQAANNFGSLSALIKLSVNVGASFSSKYLMKYVRLNERIELDCDPNGQAPVTVTWFVRQQQQQQQPLHEQLGGGGLLGPPASGNQLNASNPMFVPTSAMAGNNQSLSNYHHHHQPAAADQFQQQQQQLASAASASASGQRRRLFTGTIQTELPVGQQTAGINLLPHHLAADGHQQQHGGPVLSSSSMFGNGNNNHGGQQQKLIEIDSTMSFEILKLRNLSPPTASSNADEGAEIVRLHIKQARRSHSGEYICQAANQFGGDEKLIRLLVQEPPDPVRDIRATRIESRSVSIAWAVPFTGNSPITSYTVEWARIDGSGGGELTNQQQQQQTSGGNLAQHNSDHMGKWSQVVVQQPAASLGPLEPRTDYEIRVRAHNQFGSAPLTGAHNHQLAPVQPFVVTTLQEAPGAPPSEVRAQALSSSSVQVSWQPPAPAGSAAMGQTALQLNSAESSGKQVVSHSTRHQSHSAATPQSRLSNITGYYVAYRVAGGNSTDFIYKTVSAYSLAEDYAPGPTTTTAGPTASRYDINNQPRMQRTGNPVDSSLLRLRATLGDLKRNTKYQIIVQAFNSAGAGPPSDLLEVRTLLNDPPPAPLLRLGLVTYTSLELQWSFHQFESSTILMDSGTSATASGGSNADHPLAEPLERPAQRQMARFSPLVFTPPHTSKNEVSSDPSSLVANKEQPLVDGYHLYFRRAPLSSGESTPPALPNAWQERRLTQETHSIVENPTGGSGDLSIVEHGTRFAGSETKPPAAAAAAGGWLRFHGPNSTLAANKLLRYTLDQLTCGNQYQVYLVAYNSYGVGLPSQILRAKTRGSPPLAPRRQQDFLRTNSTLVQLALSAWTDGGCSLANFEVRYKQLRGGRPEAIEMLREGAPSESQAHEANGQNWRLLANNISPEQHSIELRDLRPETWYGIWVTAESAAGKSEALYAFMTLDQLGQVPSEALEPLPISGETNLPALFRSGTSGAGGAIRSILYNLSGGVGGYGGPNGANASVSPLILSACMVLVVFATCSLFLIRRYNNLVKDNHSIDMSSSRTTTTSAGGGGGGGKSEFDRTTTTTNHYNSGLDHYSLNDTKLNGHNCHELDHHHLHTPLQHYQQPHLSGGDTGSIISASPSNRGDQQHHYSMKLSPCKTGGGGATIITNSSSSTNGSSGAFLLGGGGGSGGDSSVCDTIAYGSSTPRVGHHHHHHAGFGDNSIGHQQVTPALQTSEFESTNCRLSRLIDAPQQQVQFCSQPNCAHEQQQQLGKFATLARAGDAHHLHHQQSSHHHHQHLTHLAGSPAVVGQVAAPHSQQRHSTSFRTLPHSSLRPVSTFLPPNALQNASGCAMTNGAVESLNRFYGADNSGVGAGAMGNQQQDLADKQQIYSKLRLLQQYQAATASSTYNLNAICQQQQQQLQEAAESNVMALSQIYGANRNTGNASSEQQQLSLIETTTGHHAQQNLATNINEQTGQPQQLLGSTQQAQQPAAAGPGTAAATGDHQDDYALPFPPKWV